LAELLQHEIDHLDGITSFDRAEASDDVSLDELSDVAQRSFF
jgi:peptide deformylase